MPQFLPAGYGQLRILFRGISAPRDSVITFGYKPNASADPFDHALNFDTWLKTTGGPFVASAFSNAYQYSGTYCTYMTESGPLVGDALIPVTGTASIQPVPPNSAVILRKQTALGGRKGRGRAFLPPIYTAEGSIGASGLMTTTETAPILAKWVAFKTAVLAGNYDLRLIHNEPIIPTLITSFSVDTLLGTQRRRMRK